MALARKRPPRIEPPLQTTHKLIDQLTELTDRYGDLPPRAVLIESSGKARMFDIKRAQVCGAYDHILLELIEE